MSTIIKRPNGKWQEKIRRKGHPQVSKNFFTKESAKRWARDIENRMDRQVFESTLEDETFLLGDLIHKYWNEVVLFQKSSDITLYTLNKLIARFPHKFLIEMTTALLKQYKEERLRVVKGDTARKELLLHKRFFEYSISEWQIYLPKGNPLNSIRLPKKGKSRKRRLEYRMLLAEANSYGGLIRQVIDIAIENSMRRCEITKLKYDSEKRIITIEGTKNGDELTVRLSTKANKSN